MLHHPIDYKKNQYKDYKNNTISAKKNNRKITLLVKHEILKWKFHNAFRFVLQQGFHLISFVALSK